LFWNYTRNLKSVEKNPNITSKRTIRLDGYYFFSAILLKVIYYRMTPYKYSEEKRPSMEKGTIQKIIALSVLFILVLNTVIQVSATNRQEVPSKNIQSTDEFDQKILDYMNTAHWPSLALAILKNNTMVWSKGYGYADIKNKRNATNTTVYMLASISKTVTATAIMQLWEKGLFDLDDDINEYLPFSVRNPNYPDVPITFRMLLAHRSGITADYVRLFIIFSVLRVPYAYLGEFLTPGGRFYSPKNWEDVRPGSTQVYSCVGYELLGYLVERLSMQSFPRYCTTNIFQPLQMNNTSYYRSDYTAEQLAVPYVYLLGKYHTVPAFEDRNYASGGLRSNLEDLSHYLLAYMNGGEYHGVRILKNDTVKLMFTLQYPGNDMIRFGLGWEIYPDNNNSETPLLIGHHGGLPGAQTYMFYHIDENAGILMFTNQHLLYPKNDLLCWFTVVDLLSEKAKTY
jgi:CubicO group peptidase (beta-lactamase class C family)